MAYATPAQLRQRFDERRLGQLASDSDARVAPAALTTDPNILAALLDASGLIDGALLKGGRYTTDDLAALPTNGAGLLVRLCATLAYGLLVQRRGFSDGELAMAAPGLAWGQQMLTALANGELIFGLDKVIAAGRPNRTVLDRRKKLLTETAARHYGNLQTDEAGIGPERPVN